MESGEDTVSIARRAVVSRRLFFSHRIIRPLVFLLGLEVFLLLVFAVLPDGRTAETDDVLGIYVVQAVLTWLTIAISLGCVALVFVTYSVTQRELTFERQSRMGLLVILKLGQLLIDVALTAYPTFLRNLFAAMFVALQLFQVAYSLYLVRQARESFTRRIRPPLVIKALLDMKGEALSGNAAEPLTLGMLERLEGIVKVKDQQKFNVHRGRDYVIVGVFILLCCSFGQFLWEMTKIITYQNRYFSRDQIAAIADASNLPMYWPSRAYDPDTAQPATAWQYKPGGAGCQESGSCNFPRDETNSRLNPMPNGEHRVVLVVIGGMSAKPEYTNFLGFRGRLGWQADAIELLMNSELPTNAVPNWAATITGLTPDLIGIFGNRNIGTTAYDNIFRMMGRFHDKWYCDVDTSCEPHSYTAGMVTSPWFVGLAKTDLPPLFGDGSTSYVSNEEDYFDRSEVFQLDTSAKDKVRVNTADMALSGASGRDYHFVLLHLTDTDSQASTHGIADLYNQANMNASHAGPTEAPWTETVPELISGTAWRANSYKRAVARSGDYVSMLIDKHGDEHTTFLVMGDHSHMPPGGMGGASNDVRHVPLFAYRKGSGMGTAHREARSLKSPWCPSAPRRPVSLVSTACGMALR